MKIGVMNYCTLLRTMYVHAQSVLLSDDVHDVAQSGPESVNN